MIEEDVEEETEDTKDDISLNIANIINSENELQI